MVKRKTRNAQTVTPSHRSTRNNAGLGGVADQLAKLGDVLESPTKAPAAKRGRVDVPHSESVNPLAPKEQGKTSTAPKPSNRRTVNEYLCVSAPVLTVF